MTIESLFLAVGFAASFWLFAAVRGNSPSVARKGTFALAAGFGVMSARERPSQTPAPEEVDHPIAELSQGFTSSKTCRSCHPSQYESWHHSYHRTMTTEPSAETVKGDFNDKLVTIEDESYRLTRSGDEFRVELADPNAPPGVAPARVSRPIRLVTGSHHMQVYWTPSGNSRVLGLMPIAYLIDDGRWVPESATYLGEKSPHAKRSAGDWLLRGDAGQRAIVAEAMGWEPAKTASGTSWMGLHLAQTLLDPYAAVRCIAARSLSRLPEFKDWQYDFVGTPMDRAVAAKEAQSIWSRQFNPPRIGHRHKAPQPAGYATCPPL